jgi:hypothetical protein
MGTISANPDAGPQFKRIDKTIDPSLTDE